MQIKEQCPLCDNQKDINNICYHCAKYINQERTPTELCLLCGGKKAYKERCLHNHRIQQSEHIFQQNFTFINEDRSVIFQISNNTFIINGIKVKQGPGEAEEVYTAFKKLIRVSNER